MANILKIKLDFGHGPIWKERFDFKTRTWSTGIDVVDEDKELMELNNKAEKEYNSLYWFDDLGELHFDNAEYKKKKKWFLSIIEKIKNRLSEINDGSFIVSDEESVILSH